MKRLLFFLFSICWLASIAQSSSYDERLRAMQEYPRTTVKVAQEALDVAMKERKSADMIDALMLLSGAQLMIDSDSVGSVLQHAELIMNSCSNAVDRSVIALYLCDVYQAHLLNNYYRCGRASYIKGNSDIATWSAQNFYDKIDSLQQVALLPVSALQNTPISRYRNIIAIEGYDGESAWAWLQRFYPSMYDFVVDVVYNRIVERRLRPDASCAIDVTSVLNDAIEFHKKRREYAPQMMWELKRLQYNNLLSDDSDNYVRAVDALVSQYSRYDFVIEVVIARYNHMAIHDSQSLQAEYNVLMRWINKYPHYYRIACLQSMCADLSATTVSLSMPYLLYSADDVTTDVVYTNADSIVCELWRGSIESPVKDVLSLAQDNVAWELCASQSVLCEGIDFQEHKARVMFPRQDAGVYRMIVRSGEAKEEVTFVITPYMLLTVESTPGEACTLLVDCQRGNPIVGEKMVLVSRSGEVLQESTTDVSGVCRWVKPSLNGAYYIHLADIDKYPFMQSIGFAREAVEKPWVNARIFTDRSLYRPGQTLQFSALVYRLDDELQGVLPDCDIEAKLYDNAGNEVWAGTFTTDVYGSIYGEIALPDKALPGMWRLSMCGENCYAVQNIEVAEYKLPQFSVECSAIEGVYSYGDSVQVRGCAMSYSGAAVGFAQVVYEVRQLNYMYGGAMVVARGNTSTQANGDFAFSFVATEPEVEYARWWGSRYVVEVTVTSPAGESRQGEVVVPVSGVGVKLVCSLPDKVCRDNATTFAMSVVNGAGVVQQLPCTISLYRTDCAVVGSNVYTRQDVALWHTRVVGSDSRVMLPCNEMQSGSYRLMMCTLTDSGELVADSVDFVCYSVHDTQPPVPVELWLPQERYEANDGDTVRIAVGSALRDASLYYFISNGSRPVEYKEVSLGNAMYELHLPFDTSCDDVVQLLFVLVYDNKVHSRSVTVTRKQLDMSLTITPTTFRDRTRPGNSETWRFNVTNADGKPVEALFMAEMYDASLDALRAHNWYFAPRYVPVVQYGLSVDYLWYLTSTDHAYLNYRNEFASVSYVSAVSPMLRNYLLYGYGIMNGGMVLRTMAQAAPNGAYYKKDVEADMISAEEGVQDYATEETAFDDVNAHPLQTVEYRNDMAETAFFYPHLVADAKGNVAIEFTVPESVTTWNFLSLAVSPQLQCGMYTASVLSSKPLMIQPNIPRFVRQGDQMVLSATVYNMTNDVVTGEAQLTLYNPENESELVVIKEPFTAPGEESATVRFSVIVPDTLSLVGVRVGAATSRYSDGEQHLLAVLPSTMVVTESKPFYIAPLVGDTTILFDAMQEKVEHNEVQSLGVVLEYCDNAAWYAVTALPSLVQSSDKSAISLMASLYANVAATGIVSNNDIVAQAIEYWSMQADALPLVSPLEQNEELKQLLLSETPWLVDALNDTDQMRQIASLLDRSRAEKLSQEIATRLRDMQLSDGGWPWYKGMQSSYTITLNVVAGLSKLATWGDVGNTESMAIMKIEALRYLDAEYLSRNKVRAEHPDYQDLCYLYVRSDLLDVPMSADVLALSRQQLDTIAAQWYKLDDIEKAYAAVALYRNRYVQVAHDIVNSLREYAHVTASQGMYWPNNRSNSFYRNSAVQVHCAIYEALTLVEPCKEEQDAMRQWLLLQKQTQAWESVPSTIDAVHILLSSGTQWLTGMASTRIEWGDTPLPQASKEEQTIGYVQYVRSGKDVDVADARLVVSNHDDKPSWGAIYWQYSANIADIESHNVDEIGVRRSYYVERNGELIPIENTQLAVGDEVTVRMTIKTDRDMQYMVLADARPACFEPQVQLPQYNYAQGLYYYSVPGDASNNFYIEYMPRGVYAVEYKVYVDRPGIYQAGVATVQSYYAPQFASHTAGAEIEIQQ
ncbi:MAG: hypothetical protein IKY75_08130 [Bacteroidaceae bacterium]|nr:hypothetical protein [Bacteroidaceae bacterium]